MKPEIVVSKTFNIGDFLADSRLLFMPGTEPALNKPGTGQVRF
jgi:hypothetical protein